MSAKLTVNYNYVGCRMHQKFEILYYCLKYFQRETEMLTLKSFDFFKFHFTK